MPGGDWGDSCERSGNINNLYITVCSQQDMAWRGFSRKLIYHIAWWTTRGDCSNNASWIFFFIHWNIFNASKIILAYNNAYLQRVKEKYFPDMSPILCFLFLLLAKTADSLKRVRNLMGELGKMVTLAGLLPVQFMLAAPAPYDDLSWGGEIPVG